MATTFSRSVNMRRWFWVALAVFTLTLLHGAYFTYLILPRIYFGTAQVEVHPRGANGLDEVNDPNSLEPEVEFIRSANVDRKIRVLSGPSATSNSSSMSSKGSWTA